MLILRVGNILNMEAIVQYFGDMPSLHRSLLLVGGLTLFMLIEQARPLFEMTYSRGRHTALNLFFTLTTVVVNFSLAFVLFLTAEWVVRAGVGLLQWVDMPMWADVILGLMLMDLIGAYLAHWVQHHVKWMWQFHVVHHTDQHIDTTSANRHHPGESLVRVGFTILAVILVGAPVWLIFLYQTASLVMTQFNHANIKMPDWLDNGIALLLASPNMHRVHHHYRQPYSDTNYGNIFSIWDRLFGTYVKVDNKHLRYGVDTYMDEEVNNSVLSLLKLPFLGYKEPIAYDKPEDLA